MQASLSPTVVQLLVHCSSLVSLVCLQCYAAIYAASITHAGKSQFAKGGSDVLIGVHVDPEVNVI